MMSDSSTSPLGRINPTTMAVVLGLAAVALNLIVVLGAALRLRAAQVTEDQIQTIKANINELDALELTELGGLQTQLADLVAEVETVEAAVPDPTSPFPTYEQAFALALEHGAQLQDIQREGMELRPTIIGSVNTEVYRILVTGSTSACFDYVEALEREGGAALAIDRLAFDRETGDCSFVLFTVARTGDES